MYELVIILLIGIDQLIKNWALNGKIKNYSYTRSQ